MYLRHGHITVETTEKAVSNEHSDNLIINAIK